jgi:hypothetical protein
MKKFILTENAKLQCSCGSSLSELKVTSQSFSTIERLLRATENDNKSEENIRSFGTCSQTKKSCIPEPLRWNCVESRDSIEGKGTLTDHSTLPCTLGGVIFCNENTQYFFWIEESKEVPLNDFAESKSKEIISSLPEQEKKYYYPVQRSTANGNFNPDAVPIATLAEANKVLKNTPLLKLLYKNSGNRAIIKEVKNTDEYQARTENGTDIYLSTSIFSSYVKLVLVIGHELNHVLHHHNGMYKDWQKKGAEYAHDASEYYAWLWTWQQIDYREFAYNVYEGFKKHRDLFKKYGGDVTDRKPNTSPLIKRY